MQQLMRTGVFVAVLLQIMVMGISISEAAEPTMTMQQLYYEVWPEYDTPDVLVIYNGTFVNDTGVPFNGELRYNVPRGARISMVCETEKGMVCQRYRLDDTADGQQVVWRPSRTIMPGEVFPIMMEYNYNNFSGGGLREFTNEFIPAFPVTQLMVAVKQPLRSTEFKLDPSPQQTQQDGEGFTNYYYEYANLAAGDQLTYNLAYQRPDAKPSVSKENQLATGSTGKPAKGAVQNNTVVLLVLVFVIVLAVVVFMGINRNKAVVTSAANRSGPRGGDQRKTRSGAGGKQPADDLQEIERRKIRKLLLDGKISEETYKQLIRELER